MFLSKVRSRFGTRQISGGTIGIVALGLGSAFGGVLYLGQKQVRFLNFLNVFPEIFLTKKKNREQAIGKLIDASVKALRSSEGQDENLSDVRQHWALLRRCMKKKGYAAELLEEAGGTNDFMTTTRTHTHTHITNTINAQVLSS